MEREKKKPKPNVEETKKIEVNTLQNTQKAEGEIKKELPKELRDKEKKKPSFKKYGATAQSVRRETGGRALPISKKQAMYLCRFIKNKSIDKAIYDLSLVMQYKKAVPFKGEIPHRRALSQPGRYPVKAAGYFINLLKGLRGNAVANGLELERTIISIASATWANRPMRRGGRLAKRANVILKAKEFIKEEKNEVRSEH